MRPLVAIFVAFMVSLTANGLESTTQPDDGELAPASIDLALGDDSIMDNELITSLKASYTSCLLVKGDKIYRKAGLLAAMDLSPTACRRELLKIKKALLNSALRIDVIDALIESIAEGARIDLLNHLIED